MMIQIVVAFEQPLFAKMLARSLESFDDIKVLAVTSDGQQAVELCKRLEPDLLVMDPRLGGCDAVRATQIIKKTSPEVRVILLASERDPDAIADAFRADIDGYIVRSADVSELHWAIGGVYAGLKVLDRETFLMIAGDYHGNGKAPTQPPCNAQPFTERELQILHMMTSGLSTSEIALHLHLSRGSVYNYISRMMSRLNVQTRVQLVAIVLQQGVIPS